MNHRVFFLLTVHIFILSFSTTFAQETQKHIDERQQLWIGYFNQTRINERWGVWTDIHYRRNEEFISKSFQFLFRPAVTYFVKDNLRLNVGYTFINHFPQQEGGIKRIEHRPWQQVWWNQKYSGLTTLQWLRLEQRFNEKITNNVRQDRYSYNFRLRYNYSFFIPLKGKEMKERIPFMAIINEVFLNFGDRVVYNTFDQNRFFAGVGYPFTSHLNMQVGYMNIYQQEFSGNHYFSTHAIRLFLFHSLDLRQND